MTWQDEFLDYQESLDDARRDEERRETAAQNYRDGAAHNERLVQRLLQNVLDPVMEHAFRRATEELARARVDQAVCLLIDRNVNTQNVSVRLLPPSEGDIEMKFQRVLISLPHLSFAVALRPPQ